MKAYRALNYVPPLVKRAINLAEQMGSKNWCSPETGRLLQLLAAQLPSGVIGEIGTGCGVGAAWIVSALSPGTSFFTVEEEPVFAAAARALFDPLLNVRVIQGSRCEFLGNWRFAMLFAGKASGREDQPELFLEALRQGGLIVLDSLTPYERMAPSQREDADPVRSFWLNDPRLLATELQVSAVESVILASRAV